MADHKLIKMSPRISIFLPLYDLYGGAGHLFRTTDSYPFNDVGHRKQNEYMAQKKMLVPARGIDR